MNSKYEPTNYHSITTGLYKHKMKNSKEYKYTVSENGRILFTGSMRAVVREFGVGPSTPYALAGTGRLMKGRYVVEAV